MGYPPRVPVLLPLDRHVVYFITFCVRERRPVLANPVVFAAFEEAIRQATRWNVIAAVLMPDHVHVLAGPLENRGAAVGELSGFIKRRVRRICRATIPGCRSVSWQWQPGSFDRLLRRDESAEEKWQYMRENPVRAGLVERWSDWPYQIGFRL
jgi:putative transposase